MEIAINKVNNQDVESNAATDSQPGSVSTIESAPSVRFAIVAKTISQVVASCGLEVPGFKSPPRCGDVDRTVRRLSRGSVVAVRIKDRPFEAVIADMIDGVVVCNDMSAERAGKLRNLLWGAATQTGRQQKPLSRVKRTVLVHHPTAEDNIEAA
ncbi:MAG: hypothetical protein CL456_08370 [Acidimicrobiaceae bacterium]|nr:hypothetical protein [Acidimicrobiaceae bacterium]|tara:strand:- start:1215 stop:1676 length:462 start_codon:yes stop_codon:yes gene_type:complete